MPAPPNSTAYRKERHTMSSKYRTLVALSHAVPVPALFALDDAQLAALWPNHAAMREEAQEVFVSIRLTAGAFLDRDLDRLDALRQRRSGGQQRKQKRQNGTQPGFHPRLSPGFSGASIPEKAERGQAACKIGSRLLGFRGRIAVWPLFKLLEI